MRSIDSLSFALALFVGMVICLEIGRRLGARALAKDPKAGKSAGAAVEGSIFGLYALLLAFTFSGAPSRLDARKHLVTEEANAIGTAYLRLDLLRADSQPAMRDLFRKYTDSRLAVFRKADDLEAAYKELAVSTKFQQEIWSKAVTDTVLPGGHPDAGKLLLPALNSMIDITATRTTAALIHPPAIIFGLLFMLALVCSMLAGHSMAESPGRKWLHITGFSLITVISVFVILEIEFPRRGWINFLDSSDQVMVDLRNSM